MPSGYGKTYGLDATTVTRLQTGFDEIRAFSGWENFGIPDYAWKFVDRDKRDRLLTWLQTAIWETRNEDSNFTEFSREALLAFAYTFGVFCEWWSDTDNWWGDPEARPALDSEQAIENIFTNDWGLPSQAISQILNLDPEINEKFLMMFYSPLGDTSTGQSFAAQIMTRYAEEDNSYEAEYVVGTGPYYMQQYQEDCTIRIKTGVFYGATPGSNTETYFFDHIASENNESYSDNDLRKYAIWPVEDPVCAPPVTDRQKYGELKVLNETTKTRLKEGFDYIRSISGWEKFQIPEYIWEWVSIGQRDFLLNSLEKILWENREGVDLPTGVPKTVQFAYAYVMMLIGEWYYVLPWSEKPNTMSIPALLVQDFGFPMSATYEADSSWGEVFERQTSRNDTMSICPVHPCYFVPSYQSAASRLFIRTNVGYMKTPEEPTDQDEYHEYAVETCRAGDMAYEFTIEAYARRNRHRGSDSSTWSTDYYYMEAHYIKDYTDPNGEYPSEGFTPEVVCWDIPPEDEPIQEGLYDGEWKPDWTPGIKLNNEYDVISASVTFRDFGYMEGEIVLEDQFEVGTSIQATNNFIPIFAGIVTGIKYNLADMTYTHKIADPVTAGGGTVTYTSGNAIDALREAIEGHGGIFETSMITEETVVYPGEPQDAYQFFRAVSYAVGGVLQYGRDGIYRLIADGACYEIADEEVVADDNPIIQDTPNEYANYVQATIDATWTEPATEPVSEGYSAGGASYSVIRLGEQIQTESIDLGDVETTTTYTYDDDGYLIQKHTTEEGSGIGATKRESTITFSNIQNNGNIYDVTEIDEEWTFCQLYDNQSQTFYTTWVPTSKTTREWHVDLNGMAKYVEIQKGSDPVFAGNPNISTSLYPVLGELIDIYKYVGAVIVDPTAGTLEGQGSAKKYAYTHNGFEDDGDGMATGTIGWVYVGTESRNVNLPRLEKCVAEEEKEVHIIAGAKDQNSIDVVGLHKYETHAVALDTDTGMQNFALGVLYEKSRIKKGTISIANGVMLPLDSVVWKGYWWKIKCITVNLNDAVDELEIETQSSLQNLEKSLPKNPMTWIEDVKNAINKRVLHFDNVARGSVLERIGKHRYKVRLEGKADPVEAKALSPTPIPVGGSVLLARPSGKNQRWSLLGLAKENEISIPSIVDRKSTPQEEKTYEFYISAIDLQEPAGPYGYGRKAVFGKQFPAVDSCARGNFKEVLFPALYSQKNVAFDVHFEGEIGFGLTIPDTLPPYSFYSITTFFTFGSFILNCEYVIQILPESGGKAKVSITGPDDDTPVSIGWRYQDQYHYFWNHARTKVDAEVVDRGTQYSYSCPFNMSANVYWDAVGGGYAFGVSYTPLQVFVFNSPSVRQTCILNFDEEDGMSYGQYDQYLPYPTEWIRGPVLTLAVGGTYSEEQNKWLPLSGFNCSGWAKAVVKNIGAINIE